MDSTTSRFAVALSLATLCSAILSLGTPAAAQTAQEDCSARLERARGQYEVQQFAEVERLIVDCVDRQSLPAAEMDEGFRLLTLAYLRENLLGDAQTTVIKHLAWSFTYEPDEVRDPPLYVALVRVTKAQLTVPPAALLASTAPTGAPAVPVAESVRPSSPAGETAGDQAGSDTDAQPAARDPQPVDTAPVQPVDGGQAPASEQAAQLVSTTAGPAGNNEPATSPERGASEPSVEPSSGTAALALREREALADPERDPARPASESGVGLVGDAAESGAGGVTGGRYGGGLSAVPGTNPTALLIPLPSDARSDKEDPYNETLDFATVMPEIIGGPDAIRLEYPDFERRQGIDGRVVVRFVVDESGDVSEAEVLRGVGPGLDAAALAALNRLRFTPARQNGQPARVRMTLTFRFQAPGRESAG